MSKTIKIASLIYASSILLSRMIGLVRESIIGRVLGESTQADVYWMAFILPDFLNYLLAGGAISLVLIPLLQQSKQQDGYDGMWQCLMRVSTPLTILVCLVTTILWVYVDHISRWLAPGFTTEQLTQLSHLTRIILPAQIFHVSGSLLSASLQSEDKHLAPAIAPILYTTGIIMGGLLLGDSWGAEGFAWGVLLGSIIGPFAAPLCALIHIRAKLKPRWEPRHEQVRLYLWRIFPVMIGFSIVVGDEMIVKRLASFLGEGMVSQLHYARILMRVPMGVFGLALGMAAFPTLSRLCTQKKYKEAHQTLNQAAESLLILVGLAQVFLICASAECAALIWGRDRMSTYGLLSIAIYCGMLSLGLWAWSLQGLAARGFYAQGKTWVPTLLGSVVMVSTYPIYLLATSWEGIGLALASSIAISCYVIVIWYAVCRSLQGSYKLLFKAALKIIVAVILSCICTEYACALLQLPHTSLLTYVWHTYMLIQETNTWPDFESVIRQIVQQSGLWNSFFELIWSLFCKTSIAIIIFLLLISRFNLPMFTTLCTQALARIKSKVRRS